MDVKKRATAPPGQAGSSTAREREDKNLSLSRLRLSLLFYSFAAASSVYLILLRTPYASYVPYAEEGFSGFTDMLKNLVDSGLTGNINGHVDFGDGRKTAPAMAFCRPKSEALSYVNVMLGNGGAESQRRDDSCRGAAVRHDSLDGTDAAELWVEGVDVALTADVSMCPYNQTDTKIHSFIGTHQPAIWMGESGPVQVMAGHGEVETDFDKRALPFKRENEYASVNYYSNVLALNKEDNIGVELSAASRVGHLRFTFPPYSKTQRYIVIDASRATSVTSDPRNVSLSNGHVEVDMDRNEIVGWNDERQDHILVGDELPAKGFKTYFVARFSHPIQTAGISRDGELDNSLSGDGTVLSAYATFWDAEHWVEVRVGVSFISIEQARHNIDLEIPDGQTLELTSLGTRAAWAKKLDLLSVQSASENNKTVLYTAFAHTLVYPYEVSENAGTHHSPRWRYYSGYVDKVLDGISYSGYSIWDTFRASTAWQLLVAPERIPGILTSMLQDYEQGGWLPMWKNIVETNIMVGTHADSIFAQALSAGVRNFDVNLAWQAVKKNAFTPPDRDTELQFADREEHTPQEVRAGLTEYMDKGWVADDLHTESGSRTLDYAYDDHAAAIVARAVGAEKEAGILEARAKSYRNLWNEATGFMESRNADGSWAGPDAGWTEGDHWAYSLNVMHDVPGLIQLMGGNDAFISFLDRHFDGGHNLHTNEPSHHIPYLYALAGAAAKTQAAVRKLGEEEYNHTDIGLSGNEDCGQMSAWYLFSAMGVYPVDPASAEYVLGAPFFDHLELKLPGGGNERVIIAAHGASEGKRYVRDVRVNGNEWDGVTISHDILGHGAEMVFEMSDVPEPWPGK